MTKFIFIFFVCFIVQSVMASPVAPQGFMMTPDGVRLFFEHVEVAPEKEKGTVVFLHGWGMSYTEWDGVKEKFQEDGWSTLAFDFRGHGASTEMRDRQLDYRKMESRRNRKRLFVDIQVAMDYLLTDKPVWLIGSSIGANYALRYAAQDKRVDGVILLAPGYDNFRILEKKTIEQYGDRPMMLVAARNNPWSFRTSMNLKERAAGPTVFFGVKSGHGFTGFKDKTPFISRMLNWVNHPAGEAVRFEAELATSPVGITIEQIH